MAYQSRPTYQLNLNRNPTRKWAEAQSVDYGGGGWGDDEEEDDWYDEDYGQAEPEPVSTAPVRHAGWDQRDDRSGQRSFTNPTLMRTAGRSSFDNNDDRRYFSAGGFDARFQSQPTQLMQEDSAEHTARAYANPPPLQVHTNVPATSVPSTSLSDIRQSPYTDVYGVPYSAPVGRSTQPLHSYNMAEDQAPSSGNLLHQRQSNAPGMLPGPQVSTEIEQSTQTNSQFHAPSQSQDTKPLPFIRPADIYKRVEEEREKERRSQESSRPSIDSISGNVMSSPNRPGDPPSRLGGAPNEDLDNLKKSKPALDTVQERENEFATGTIGRHSSQASRTAPTSQSLNVPTSRTTVTDTQRPISTAASSIYTDRPDPVSASSTGSPPRNAFTSKKSSSTEPFPHSNLLYSPSTQRQSGLRAFDQTIQDDDDLPNFDRGMSPPISARSSYFKPAQNVSSQLETNTDAAQQDQLRHQRSVGYKSAVQQAFDAENSNTLSPSSTNATMPRSDSNSTSEISPIIGRKSGPSRSGDTAKSLPVRNLPNEAVTSDDQAQPVVERQPVDLQQSRPTLPASTFVPGYRRDNNLPDDGASKAHRPLSVEIPTVPEAQQGFLSMPTTSSDSLPASVPEVLPPTQYIATDEYGPLKASASQSELAPPSSALPRSTSQEFRDWQAQSKQIHAKHGIKDSATASPVLSSTISRTESPAKGTVRDIADRLESNSSQSSPVVQSGNDSRSPIVSKPLQSRNESFRPVLPGSWQSYNTSTSNSEPGERSVETVQPSSKPEPSSRDSTESIPTATAPKHWQSSGPGTIEAAFAAAAAAGTAMAGAFTGSSASRDPQIQSEIESDGDVSEVMQSQPPESSETRDFATVPKQRNYRSTDIGQTISESSQQPHIVTSRNVSTEADPSVEFPAPLRTNRFGENNQPSPRLTIPHASSEPNEHDAEQLQHDIVQSLTPKSSRVDDITPKPAESSRSFETSTNMLPRQDSVRSDDDSVLPHEYSSYWDEQQAPLSQPRAFEEDPAEIANANLRVHPKPGTTTDEEVPDKSTRPALEQRYSWEAAFDRPSEATKPLPASFGRGVSGDQPRTSTGGDVVAVPPSVVFPPTPNVHKAEEEVRDAPGDSATPKATPATNVPASSSFPQAKAEFRNILSFKDTSQRIRAFDENRQVYAQPSGLLEQWLSSMDTPEHADVFRTGRLPRSQPNAASTEARPSLGRDQSATSGTKQMQEDGKRLLAAAGKYGGKAGVVAKGLFSKGKDKLRSASYGDKVQSNRRSSNIEKSVSPIPRDATPRDTVPASTSTERAPQLPTPSLETPTGEPTWSALSSQIDQMFTDQPRQANASSLEASKSQYPVSTISDDPDRPPASVLAAIPDEISTTHEPDTLPDFSSGVETPRGNAAPRNVTESLPSIGRGADNASRVSADHVSRGDRARMDSLPVPRERRPSSISDVSDISAAQDQNSEVVPRTISPTPASQVARSGDSAFVQKPQTKQEEAEQDRMSYSEGTLPAYSSAGNGALKEQRHSRVISGTQIVPVADLKNTDTGTDAQPGSRPFSFFGSETLNHAISQQARLHQPAGNVRRSSIDEGNRVDPEKSPQPNIVDHPAYRNTDQDRSALEQANPLPSSRRSPQELEKTHKPHQIVVPSADRSDESYRIPGPYHQEYRSPRSSKPTLNQEHPPYAREGLEDHQNAGPGARFVDSGPSGISDTHSQLEGRPESDQSRNRFMDSVFGARSTSRSRGSTRDGAMSPGVGQNYSADEGKRRKGSFFGLGNRSTSPSRQTSNVFGSGSRGQETPGSSGRVSMDHRRSSTFGPKSQADTKKKRSSGLISLFGKSSVKDRDKDKDNYRLERNASVPISYGPNQSPRDYQQYSSNQMQHPQSAVEPRYAQSPSAHDAYAQFARSAGASSSQPSIPGTAYQETRGYPGPGARYPSQDQVWNNNSPNLIDRSQTQASPPPNVLTAMPRGQDPYYGSSDSFAAPTAGSPPVPITRTQKDISYGADRPYIPPSSPRPHQGSVPAEPKMDMADHVKNLHKRSRSPRLGRQPSDEHLHGDPSLSVADGRGLPQDPANRLGTFSNKKISPQGGVQRSDADQEGPWTIGLPEGREDRRGERYSGMHVQGPPSNVRGKNNIYAEQNPVSPASPHRHGRDGSLADVVSPVTAVEPRGRVLDAAAPRQRTTEPIVPAMIQPRSHDGGRVLEEDVEHVTPAPAEQVPVPPSLSNASYIPHPNPHLSDALTNTAPGRVDEAHQSPSSPQASRSLKQGLLERSPENAATSTGPVSSRPLTVADKIMGIQPAARGTIPEHRSTTPVPHSPAHSVGGQSKSTTWPDQYPSTTGLTAANNGGTTVTTTTMRTGSKLGKGSIKTSTYIVDSNAPSRASSIAPSVNSGSIKGRTVLGNPVNMASPLSATTANANVAGMANSNLNDAQIQSAAGSKHSSTNGAVKAVPVAGKSFDAVELPGSKPDGYESEEEIVMSATAYPGQEWMPDYAMGGWEEP